MYKENFEAGINNLEAFWEREDFGRCALSLAAPLSDAQFPHPVSLEEKWMDENYRYNAYKHSCENTYFGGEFFPSFFVNFGPGALSACIGGDFVLADDTVWFDRTQIITDWNNIPDFRLDKNSVMWQSIEKLTKKFLKNPDFITGMTDIGGVMDILASLRGSENLLYDLYDYPDEVKSVINTLDELWREAFDSLNGLISEKQSLFSSWMGIPSKKSWYPIQCDFAALISPSLFEQFVLESVIKHTKHLKRSIYHLDGVGEIPHLDMLLDIGELTGIQWTAGAGQPNVADPCWFPLYKRIQDKNKNLVLLEADPDGIECLLSNLDRKGLFIFSNCASKENADYILSNAEKWCEK